MQHRKLFLNLTAAAVLSCSLSLPANAHTEVPGNAIKALLVQPLPGAEAIRVSGQGPASQPITITLVSTIDLDIPNIVLSRTSLKADTSGTFSTAISIAPGFTRGSIITVYVTSPSSNSAASARYLPDSPNSGVAIPLDALPRSIR